MRSVVGWVGGWVGVLFIYLLVVYCECLGWLMRAADPLLVEGGKGML